MNTLKVGVLAFHGDVSEHEEALKRAAEKLKLHVDVVLVRTKQALLKLDALIIPGGESTTLQKLCEREGMWGEMKKIKNIFGTCAGAILLAKKLYHREKGQKTLEIMDIDIDRNAYGRQNESFEDDIQTDLGATHAVFIRAPQIKRIGKNVVILAKRGSEIVACEERVQDRYYLAACFHPEVTSTLFHEYFLKQIQRTA
ncbi:hypothetical protein A3H16_00105 [Candidatus Kaiserbacteria bacterium RIFCSPLOWO2_12_FULL_53_8]|uniref:glutaminase n=2 Tax=Candidatus Kaiseribacteriota TaxID=1752734 RepID=A0A1F6CTW0_9BACT|nr:MAG: hypothetical protein A2851_01535 [Candidatus Kaiserbacteria bacterium RIFCSPHIGHO2_01_FULL_53_29]OGG92285.1 MAG: hypothetical protein A3H16_00105 [Candidatus Kaiserbacteria bacterium RIFCSPLOWO2_12_FULL_53_8]